MTAVMVVAAIAGLLAMALADRAIRGVRRGVWDQGHLALRLIAESAVEDLYLQLQRQANTPGRPCFETLRRAASAAEPVPVEDLEPTNLLLELSEQEKALGGKLRLEHAVAITSLSPGVADPMERCGRLVVEARVKLERRGAANWTERVVTERAFRVVRVAPPAPLDQAGLFVGRMPRKVGRLSGRPAFALAPNGGHTLMELLNGRGADGFVKLPRRATKAVGAAFGVSGVDAMAERAQFVAQTPRELEKMLAPALTGRGPISGAYHLTWPGAIRLSFKRLEGNLLISSAGPIELGDVTLADPARDSLTIVGSTCILVTGRRVEANLVATGKGPNGLLLAERTHFVGSVSCREFPHSSGLTVQQFGSIHFERAQGPVATASPSRYVVALSPYPVSVRHAHD